MTGVSLFVYQTGFTVSSKAMIYNLSMKDPEERVEVQTL